VSPISLPIGVLRCSPSPLLLGYSSKFGCGASSSLRFTSAASMLLFNLIPLSLPLFLSIHGCAFLLFATFIFAFLIFPLSLPTLAQLGVERAVSNSLSSMRLITYVGRCSISPLYERHHSSLSNRQIFYFRPLSSPPSPLVAHLPLWSLVILALSHLPARILCMSESMYFLLFCVIKMS